MTETEKQEFSQIWESLTDNQRKFAIARSSSYPSDAAAAKSIKISPSTCRGWSNREQVARAVFLLINNQRDSAMAILESALPRAIEVLLEIVADPKTPRTRLAAVTDVLDRVMGTSIQRVAPVQPNGVDPYTPGTSTDIDAKVDARILELARIAHERRLAHERAIEGIATIVDVTAEYLQGPEGTEPHE